MVAGLIGGIGSGKSTVIKILESEYSFIPVIMDDIAQRLEEPGKPVYERLLSAFGRDILEDPEGGKNSPVDKKAFAALIYSDRDALRKADAIIHPAVWDYVKKTVRAPGNYIVETALPNYMIREICDMVWYVRADRDIRIKRLMESRGYSMEKCMSIMDSQLPEESFAALSDAVIDNSLPGMSGLYCRIRELMA